MIKIRPTRKLLLGILPLLIAITPFFFAFAQAQEPPAEEAVPVSEANQACLGCHDPANEGGPGVHMAALQGSPHASNDCTDCHAEFTADAPHTTEMKKSKVACENCHPDVVEAFNSSVHGQKAATDTEVPTCISCHSDGKDPHAIQPSKTLTKKVRVEKCSVCHNDKAIMTRHGVDPEAVSSYEASFHGKAFLKFENSKTAICTDCHTNHSVMAATNPKSSTNDANVAKTCGQAGCHPGANASFAQSGFSHLHITIKDNPLLSAIEWFFKILTFGVIGFLLMGVAFDMKAALFSKKPIAVTRPVAFTVAAAFFFLVLSIILAVLKQPYGLYTTAAAVIMGAASGAFHVASKPKRDIDLPVERRFQRFTVSQRLQHLTLMITFILLVLTGMPIRYPNNDVMRGAYLALGGMDVMRLVHRVSAVILIIAWIYHTIELLVRWKKAGFSMDSWTMWPRKKDFSDVVGTVKYHLGMAPEEPEFDRFQFREKFDYFAVYWGMPIMVFSGLILWYPVFYSQFLPSIGLPIAFIAHSDEAVLAFLTIATWHFYNTHFNPHHFPMNPVFITGEVGEKDMQREHPLEYKRIVESGELPEE